MTVLEAWKDSLSFFKWQHLKMFLLVTLKSIIDTYKIMFKYWWFLYAILFVIPLTLIFPPLFILNMPLWSILYVLLFFLVCLAARPSRELKNYAYFKGYIQKFWPLLLITFAASLIGVLNIGLLHYPFILFLLFSLDSDNTFDAMSRAFLNAIKMFIYNVPIFLATILLLWFATLFIVAILAAFVAGIALAFSPKFFMLGIGALGVISLLIPIEICIVTNIYIKKLHEQSELYFTTQK